MTHEEVDALRQMIASPGWDVLSQVLRERVAFLAREVLFADEVRELTRGEARALLKMLNDPVMAVEEFDTASREQATDARWVEEALANGFRMAGLPGFREEVTHESGQP